MLKLLHTGILFVFFNVQKSIKKALQEPEFLTTDFAKFDRPALLHLGFQVNLKRKNSSITLCGFFRIFTRENVIFSTFFNCCNRVVLT